MKIAFLNPQGNFDPEDSFLTEHPDFGGQLVYVKELCLALARSGESADILTRRILDADWPGFSQEEDRYHGYPDNPRIIRIPFGGGNFLRKEELWDHLEEFADKIAAFYGKEKPRFVTAHYADGGYAAVLLKQRHGLPFSFTAHSLGAHKLEKLSAAADFAELDRQYRFSRRIAAERSAMRHAGRIICSTEQERREQYSHPLYEGALGKDDSDKFEIVPPGINTRIFNRTEDTEDHRLQNVIFQKLTGCPRRSIILSSRLDEKKNHLSVVKAYAAAEKLSKAADLGIFLRGIEDPRKEAETLPSSERKVLTAILDLVDKNGLRNKVFFLNLRSQRELAAAYKYYARFASVFALSSYYEPFGLAPIEAAACGLAPAVTKNGGPAEVFPEDTAALFDPEDIQDIAKKLQQALENARSISEAAVRKVCSRFTWERTAEGYLNTARKVLSERGSADFTGTPVCDEQTEKQRILHYLRKKGGDRE
jgi:sucrose-phosphate synthase